MKLKRVVVLPDIHVPYQHKPSIGSLVPYLAQHRWDELIILGDLVDFDFISRFHSPGSRSVVGKTIDGVCAEAGALLGQLAGAARLENPGCKITLLEGNHDWRLERYIEERPELGDTISLAKLLDLDALDIDLVKSHSEGKLYRVGKAHFHHGRFTNKYHAFKMVDTYGVNIFYGHLHSVQEHHKAIYGQNETVVGKSIGCLCRHDLDYIHGSPTSWKNAFSVMHFYPDGAFQEQTITIHKGKFVGHDGELYCG